MMHTEPLRGAALLADLRAIIAAPVRDLPPVTADRLGACYSPARAGRMGAKAAARKSAHHCRPRVDQAEARRLHAEGQTTDQLAARYGVTPRQVNRILAAGGAYRRGNPKMLDAEFRTQLAKLGAKELAKRLGQKTFSVTRRARRLGLLP